ncbi:MAG: hypothetical protein HOP31_08960 [Ignavibacteria bacterium]|nr:hypothetical protein [Ignavibacteria bacterium]
MSFKPIYRFLKIKYKPAKKEDDKNSFEFTYDLIKGHNENGQEIKESFTFKSYDEPVQTFKDALQGLCPYLTGFCELPKDYASKIKVRGISVSYGEHEDGRKIPGVIISGVMQYKKSHGVLPINTPFKQSEFLSDSGGDESKLLGDECFEVIETLFHESERYIKGEREKIEIDFAEQEIKDKADKLEKHKSSKKAVNGQGNIIDIGDKS